MENRTSEFKFTFRLGKKADVNININEFSPCYCPSQRCIPGMPCLVTSEGQKLAAEFGIPFAEVSAKNDIKVDDSFQNLAKAVKDRLVADGQGGPAKQSGLNLKAGQATQNKANKCCGA